MLTVKKDHSMLVHNLVQEVTRLKSEESGKTKEDIKTIFQLLQKGFPYHSDKLEDHTKRQQLLPHLEAFFSHINDWLEKNSSEKQTIEKNYLVYLLIWMSSEYYYLGSSRRQKKLLEQALSIFKKYYGSDHFTVAIALANLGVAYGI
ncbi:tetratricopeptide repeat protein [Wolbachia endosymbiont (group A) of Pogonocherus hispidulus]|uniref:tetratricopeptide repeat protein n=1 Tax=Wolbachia endosymbiont (group A) of Pogonocherus hispidulus TaxID=3066136 RepID=UPI003342D13D